MNLISHEPGVKIFVNGVQITFDNQYTVLIKNGMGAKCTQATKIENAAEMILATRFGGSRSPDVEVEVYDSSQKNITEKFGEQYSLGFLSPAELVNLLYIVSNLQK